MSHSPDYLDRLTAACAVDPRIHGLVLFGSSADRSRADEWSDHDFAAITAPHHIAELRDDLSPTTAGSSHGGENITTASRRSTRTARSSSSP